MKRTEAVKIFAEQWRHLKAWGRPLLEVFIKYEDYKRGNYGICYPVERRCVIRVRADIPDSLDTVLHELAHAAVPAQEHHGAWWRKVYAQAVEEVTGRAIPAADSDDYCAVRALGTEALRAWWKEKGFDRIWALAKD